MKKEQVYEMIHALLLEKYPQKEITEDTFLEFNIQNNLDMTSIEIVEFIVDIEEKFDIIIDFSERLYTVGDIVESVFNHLKEDH